MGTLGRHLLVEPDINQPSWATLASVSTSTNENSIRPYAGYSTIQMFQSEATSNYYGLQLKLTRRVGRVYFTSAYTFSKVLTDASSDTQNDENTSTSKPCTGLRPSTSGTYSSSPHSGICRRCAVIARLLRQPLGGWTLSAVVHLQSGFYYTPVGNNRPHSHRLPAGQLPGSSGDRAEHQSERHLDHHFERRLEPGRVHGAGLMTSGEPPDPAAWKGPAWQIYNLSLAKSFTVNEAAASHCGFAADFINAFNHTNFQAPAANASDSTFGDRIGGLSSAQHSVGNAPDFLVSDRRTCGAYLSAAHPSAGKSAADHAVEVTPFRG